MIIFTGFFRSRGEPTALKSFYDYDKTEECLLCRPCLSVCPFLSLFPVSANKTNSKIFFGICYLFIYCSLFSQCYSGR
jgi:Fe-S-cluster-containing hydrogenase component 2